MSSESTVHRNFRDRLLEEITVELAQLASTVGVLVAGSTARGDDRSDSDLDLYVFRSDDSAKSFDAHKRQGIRVEVTTLDIDTAKRELDDEAMRVYTYLDGRVLYDPEGLLENLVSIAHERFVSFRSSPEARKAIAYWLENVTERLEASIRSGDELRAGYLTSTVSWKMLEGLWTASDRPMPPSGSVWTHLPELDDDPAPLQQWLRRAFIGDTQDRANATLTILRRTVARLHDA